MPPIRAQRYCFLLIYASVWEKKKKIFLRAHRRVGKSRQQKSIMSSQFIYIYNLYDIVDLIDYSMFAIDTPAPISRQIKPQCFHFAGTCIRMLLQLPNQFGNFLLDSRISQFLEIGNILYCLRGILYRICR